MSLFGIIRDAVTGVKARVEANGGLAVNIQDQTTEPIDLLFIRQDATFTIASNMSIDDTTFTATGGHGITAGDIIELAEGTRLTQFEVLNVATNVITIDSPSDVAYTTSATCVRGTFNMNVDGSSTPQIFRVSNKNLADGEKWDMTRMIFAFRDNAAMDISTFGGIAALTNGIVVRLKNGITKNIFNIKTNGQFSGRSYDTEYIDKAPAGEFGLAVRRTFAGSSKTGITLRLTSTSNDEFQIIVNDDLTGLITFGATAQGHVVAD